MFVVKIEQASVEWYSSGCAQANYIGICVLFLSPIRIFTCRASMSFLALCLSSCKCHWSRGLPMARCEQHHVITTFSRRFFLIFFFFFFILPSTSLPRSSFTPILFHSVSFRRILKQKSTACRPAFAFAVPDVCRIESGKSIASLVLPTRLTQFFLLVLK